MKVPTFAYMGGKARIRKQIAEYFPHRANTYGEPFVGAGNMFFWTKHIYGGQYQRYLLNDAHCKLLSAIRGVDLTSLPDTINRKHFDFYKGLSDSGYYPALVLEPRISFGGKGYAAGFGNTGAGSHQVYKKGPYQKMVYAAKQMLDDSVILTHEDYTTILPLFQDGDFVYLDPPYYGTRAGYPNIDHAELCALLNELTRKKVKWALSGYENAIYTTCLDYKHVAFIHRNNELKNHNSRKASPVVETLWMNYRRR